MSEEEKEKEPSGKMVRIPTASVERAQGLAPALEASPLGGAIRWTDAALIRLAVKRGLDVLEAELKRTTSAEACAAVACSDDPRELVRVAFEHWDNIGWPEDKGPVSLLKRALELLSC